MRCDKIHSSINQFVVFKKLAEMNNKYDVKKFSDLIENFKLEDEMNIINDFIKEYTLSSRVDTFRQINFDSIID